MYILVIQGQTMRNFTASRLQYLSQLLLLLLLLLLLYYYCLQVAVDHKSICIHSIRMYVSINRCWQQ